MDSYATQSSCLRQANSSTDPRAKWRMIIIVAISGSAKIKAHDRSWIFPSAEEPKSCAGLLRILVRIVMT